MSEARKHRWLIPSLATVFLLLGSTAPGQNSDFRLSNIERRLDQMQNRVDSVEREQRMQTLATSTRPEVARETVLELQRQQNSLAEQVVTIERRMLEIRKMIDQLDERVQKNEDPRPKPVEPPRKRP